MTLLCFHSKASLLDKLEQLWDQFIENTQQSIKNFLGIPHLAHVLEQVRSKFIHFRYTIPWCIICALVEKQDISSDWRWNVMLCLGVYSLVMLGVENYHKGLRLVLPIYLFITSPNRKEAFPSWLWLCYRYTHKMQNYIICLASPWKVIFGLGLLHLLVLTWV